MNRVMLQVFAMGAGAAAVVVSVVVSGVALTAGEQASAGSVFTAQQAAAGKAAYAKYCASCHQPDLSGDNEIPPLAGKAFVSTWRSRSTKDLFDYMSAAMPYGAPSLSTDTYTLIAAYILQSNGGAAGRAPLSPSTVAPLVSVTGRVQAPAVP